MKNIVGISKKTAAVLIAAVMFAFASCSDDKKTEKRVYDYLGEKYPTSNFEIVNFTQNKTTNGWYIVNAVCTGDAVNFTLYVSPLDITDSYGVTAENLKMDKKIMTEILTEYEEYVARTKWLDEFEDGQENYAFRTVDMSCEYDISCITKMHSIEIENCDSVSSAAGLIYDIIRAFSEKGIFLADATFLFDIGECSYSVRADFDSTANVSRENFVLNVCGEDERIKISGDAKNIIIDLKDAPGKE